MTAVNNPMDRRRFIGGIVVTTGGAAAGALVPVSLLEAREVCAAVAAGHVDPCGDWTVDDMCNAYPPYAFDIRRALAPHVPAAAAPVADADRQWVAP